MDVEYYLSQYHEKEWAERTSGLSINMRKVTLYESESTELISYRSYYGFGLHTDPQFSRKAFWEF